MGNNPCNDPVSLSQISARQPKNLLSSTNVPSRGEYCAQTSQTAVVGAEGYSGYQTGAPGDGGRRQHSPPSPL